MHASIFLASALAAFASAQAAKTTQSQAMPPQATAAFNPGNVSSSDAENWCLAQQHTCPEICGSTEGGYASVNTCDYTTFTYSCICANGTEPDCTRYQQTLPFYICQATFQQCIALHVGDATGQANCKTNEQCGSLNASALEATAAAPSSSSPTAASMTTPTHAKTSSGSAATSSPSGGAAVSHFQHLGTGAFAAVLFAAFKLIL